MQIYNVPTYFVLASQSPRRRELLERMGITEFEVLPARGEEVIDPALPPAELVEALSRQKCMEVAALRPEALVIAADTVVAIDGEILGKPHSEKEAFSMLTRLSGRTHQVYTGVTVWEDDCQITEHEVTQVRFRPLSGQEIYRYIATGEPMDKAGAYGIQGYGSLLVEGISGDYYNVMGLPVCRLARILKQYEIDLLEMAFEKELSK
ncbi:MAG: septum formation inhibitor Maf [Lawsonibacter sp.]|nr:septum formation inhibitor Maf [Lawsonibacter sp.]